MNKTSSYPEEDVRDSWEELADEMTIPQPATKKTVKKILKKSEEKPIPQAESPRNDAVGTTSTVTKLSSSPEIGKVRILKRDPAMQTRPGQEKKAVAPSLPIKTYEERVAAYNEARLRIFGSLDDDIAGNSTNPVGREMNMSDAADISLNTNSISKNAQPSNFSAFGMHR
ncbi:uncharacterized protein LOC129586174 [Paramacrobiotus metropolitanus]|uniref:uncharacterized protein LOC129586174 n=1 Tax=Paramacrobiotus metropolitanus TaxID=2943436 RepID=UPI00244657BA|nr:uncharacterized protein LOC129586174 [Paramacrobiotus metropolitanus]